MLKRITLTVGAALLIGGAAVLASPQTASAAAMPVPAKSTIATVTDNALLQDVRHRRYDRHRHGYRYSHRRRGYSHFYGGFWYAYPWWLHSQPAYRPDYGRGHVDWCLNRYRSYNPRTDAFLGYDGRYHRCISPYR